LVDGTHTLFQLICYFNPGPPLIISRWWQPNSQV